MPQSHRSLRRSRERHGSPHFLRNGLGHFVNLRLINLNNPLQEFHALTDSCLRVPLEGSFRGGYCLVNVGRTAEGDRRDRILAGGVDDFEVAGFGWTDPFSIDIKMTAVLHTSLQLLA